MAVVNSRFWIIVSAIAALGAALLYWQWGASHNVLRVAVGPANGEDTRIIYAIAQILKREQSSIRLRVVPTEGSVQSAQALDAGQVDLAVVRSDALTPANAPSIAILHTNAALLMAPLNTGIDEVADLAGKTVGILRGNPNNERLLDVILAQYGVPSSMVARRSLQPSELAQAATQLDAVLVFGAVPGTVIDDAVSVYSQARPGGLSFIGVNEAEALAQRQPAYESIRIVRGTFGGTPPRPAETLTTVGVTFRLVAKASADQADITELTRHIFENRAELAAMVPLAAGIAAPDTAKTARHPVHPGAAAFLDDEELTFMDEYGDWIYFSVMVVGIFGSAFAALSTRFRRQSHEQARRLEQLLGLMRTARRCHDADELDRLEQDADDIFAATLQVAAHEEIDPNRLAAFSLALEQVRHAIGERRRLLGLGQPPEQPQDRPRLRPRALP
jgi:TRAP transporter TAXI family solute receptor